MILMTEELTEKTTEFRMCKNTSEIHTLHIGNMWFWNSSHVKSM